MSKKLLVVLLLCATVRAFAQTSGPFGQLDFSTCETGHLLNLAARATMPHNPDTLKILNHQESAHWLHLMHQTAFTSTSIVPPWDQIRQTELRHSSQGIVSITLAHFHYNFIRPDAWVNGDLTFADSVFHMTPGADIYETRTFMAAHLSQDYWPEQTVKFILDADLLFTDADSGPMTIEWDAGDGQGWRPLIPNAVNEIQYSDNSHHTLLFRITDDEQGSKITGSILKSGGCSSSYPMPVTPPWSSSNTGSYPFGISCAPDGIQVSGNAYYLPAGDFDKPFIFVEGIDFTPLQSAMQNGDFGWCQFTSGYEALDYPYSMISLMPKFLDSLRIRGYDVILVDFTDGARSMNDNASLLIELIHLINSFKTGDHPNIIAGASMGGQVCRYALKRMEELGQEHCCRLWISFDSPNSGAYVPIALQQVLDVLSDEPLASYAINNKLLSPAAKQMLLLQHFQSAGYTPGGTDDFQDWYSNLGYPSDCRKVAVTNGSLTGSYQKDQYGNTNSHYDHLLSYNCDALACAPGPEARFFMTPSCGDPWYSDANGNQSSANSNVTAQVILSELSIENGFTGAAVGGLFGGLVGGLLGGTAGVLCFPDQQITTYSSPASLPNFDYAPGGYSNSLVEIVAGINDEGTLTGNGCPAISDDNANLFHCFIPTSSALGVTGVGLYDDLDNLLELHPELCPFDAFIGPLSYNQPHTHLSWENMRFLLDEITGGENAMGDPLIPDNLIGQTFNYGKSGYHELAAVDISGNGKIAINHHLPYRYGNAGEPYPSDNSHFKVSTLKGCSDPITRILNGGQLIIGDAIHPHTAELNIEKNGTIEIHSGGSLTVCQGSTLRILNGGLLILEQGSLLNINNASLEIMPGGMLQYNGGNLTIQGSSAKIKVDQGKIRVMNEGNLELFFSEIGSHLIVESGTHDIFEMGIGAKLHIRGTSQVHDVLILSSDAEFSNSEWQTGQMRFSNCGIRMAAGSSIQTDLKFIAQKVKFHADDINQERPSLALWNELAKFTDCDFHYTKITGNTSRCVLVQCNLNDSKMSLYEGSFSLISSTFLSSTVSSNELQYTSNIRNCTFSGFNNHALRDMSLTEMLIENSQFNDGATYAIEKTGGLLTLKCNQFYDVSGVRLIASSINMSSTLGGGYNVFSDCNVCLDLHDAHELYLQKGFNDFRGFTQHCMQGTLNQNCNNNCEHIIEAHYNQWNSASAANAIQSNFYPCGGPNMDDFDIQLSVNDPCGGYEAGGCNISIYDASPQCESTCPTSKPEYTAQTKSQRFSLKSDSLWLIEFEGDYYSPLELWTLCNDSNYIDTIGNLGESNECIATLFYEVYEHDSAAYYSELLENIRLRLKRNIELMVSISDDPYDFPNAITEDYINIMNTLTDTNLTEETYRGQFYRELDKAQFFIAIERPSNAMEVLENMDNCLLDSVEANILSIWRQRIAANMNWANTADTLTGPDVISEYSIDSTASTEFANQSNYYFGCLIANHDDYSFISCGDDLNYRSLPFAQGQLYPNPANEYTRIKWDGTERLLNFRIIDSSGRICRSGNYNSQSHLTPDIKDLNSLGEGIYVVEYSTREARYRSLLQVVHR